MILLIKYLLNSPINISGTDIQARKLAIWSDKEHFQFHLPITNTTNIILLETLANSHLTITLQAEKEETSFYLLVKPT